MHETFSSSCRSCLLLASLEQRFCSGATTVQIQRPSASCAELYTCHPSLGPIVWRNTHIYFKRQFCHIHSSWCRSKTILYDIDSMILFSLKEKTVFHSLFHAVTKNMDINASQKTQKHHKNTLKLSICLIHLVKSCTITKLNYVLYYLLN